MQMRAIHDVFFRSPQQRAAIIDAPQVRFRRRARRRPGLSFRRLLVRTRRPPCSARLLH